MSFKVSDTHRRIIANFMEEHKDLAAGRLSGPSGRERYKKLWTRLAAELNSSGLGDRSVEKWQKTWTDLKYNLKRKASALKVELTNTGSGSNNEIFLSDFEKRMLNIFGKSFYERIKRPESVYFISKKRKVSGREESEPEIEETVSLMDETVNVSTAESSLNSSASETELVLEEPVAGTSSSAPKFLVTQTNPITYDHSYIKATKNKRPKLTHEEVREETLAVLKEINATLNNSLPNIAGAINRLADVILEKFQ